MASSMRQPSPVNPARKAKLETRRHPLYDNVVFDQATSGALTFFQDPFGSGGKTELDTNMEKAGSLPSPRVFDIHKVELAASLALSTRSAGLFANEGVANETPAAHNALLRWLWTTYFELKVGPKNYFDCPSFLLPSNNGFDGGIIGADLDGGTFANGLRIIAGQSVGMEWSIARRRIRLLPDQVFRAYLNFPITLSGIASGAGRVIYCVLHGLEYREVS